MVTVNGIRCSAGFMASSTLRIDGLWLPAMTNLNCGMYSKKSWRMKRAETLSPPVMALDLGLVPAPTLLGFDGRHEAGAAQARQIGGMPVAVRASMKVSIGALAA